MINIPDLREKIYCNSCERDTMHNPISTWPIKTGISLEQNKERTYEVMQCSDCKVVILRILNWVIPSHPMSGDRYVERIETFPARHFRIKPFWYKQLVNKYRSILDEVYLALDNGLYYIASTGIRTAIDLIISDKIGDYGTYKQKIDLLIANNIVTKEDREIIDAVIDAGSASAHRGFQPDKELINHMVEITEQIIYRICIEPIDRSSLIRKAKALKLRIPKRKKA